MSKKFRVLTGFAAIAIGLMMFMGMAGRRHAMHAGGFAHHAERYESAQAGAAERGDGDSSAETNSRASARENAHFGHGRHMGHRGGLIGGLLRLLVLGLILKLIIGGVRRRRGKGNGHMRAESADDLNDEIRVGDEIGQKEAAANATATSPEDMTVDDLILAMKRLGIKKLEL